MKILLVIFVALLLFSCDYANEKLVVVNNSDSAVYYTIRLDTNIAVQEYGIKKLSTGQSDKPPISRGRGENVWQNLINNSIDGKLHIYFMPMNGVTNEVIEHQQYKHYSFTVNELDNMNWVFVYNGK